METDVKEEIVIPAKRLSSEVVIIDTGEAACLQRLRNSACINSKPHCPLREDVGQDFDSQGSILARELKSGLGREHLCSNWSVKFENQAQGFNIASLLYRLVMAKENSH